VIVVKGLHLLQVTLSAGGVAHTIITEGEHILAMDEVLRVERVLPDEQVGQMTPETELTPRTGCA